MSERINMPGMVKKAGQISADEMELINAQALEPLEETQIYKFKIAACNDQIDRDGERFTEKTLKELAELYVGKTVIFDHEWSAANQTARIYKAYVEEENGVKNLIVCAYMLKAGNESIIAAIDGGILREVSVGCAVKKYICSICGEDYRTCMHIRGREYSGETCVVQLAGAADAYEVSFVAVPAQPKAGVTKAWSGDQETKNEAAKAAFEYHKKEIEIMEVK